MRASRARGDGAGLGLAIVQAIAQGHDGRAAIVEGPAGTTVRVVLPAAPPDGETAGPLAAGDAAAAGRSQVPLI